MHKESPEVSDEAMKLLLQHPFWGNIRELKAYIVDAVARCEHGRIEENLIAGRLAARPRRNTDTPAQISSLTDLYGHFPSLEELIEYAVKQALASPTIIRARLPDCWEYPGRRLHKRLKKKPR